MVMLLATSSLFSSYFHKYSQKFNSLARMMKPLYASFLRKIPQCGPWVSIRYHGFLPFFCFQLVLWVRSHLEPAGAMEALLPFYFFPGCCPLQHCVFNLWHGFPFLVVNRPLTLLLENDPGLICSPSLLSLHSLALCCMRAQASLKIKSWKWVYKLTLE